MPTEGLSKIDENQKARIRSLIQNMKKFDQIEQEALFEEVEDDYFRTMNSIIARKHIS